MRFLTPLFLLLACGDNDEATPPKETDADADADADADTDETFDGTGEVRFINLGWLAGASCDHDGDSDTEAAPGCANIWNEDQSVVAENLGPGWQTTYFPYPAAAEVTWRVGAAGSNAGTPDARPETALRGDEQLSVVITDEIDDVLLQTYRLGTTVVVEDPEAPATGTTRLRVFNASQTGPLEGLTISGVEYVAVNRLDFTVGDVPTGEVSGSFSVPGFGDHTFTATVADSPTYLFVVDRLDDQGILYVAGYVVDGRDVRPDEVTITKVSE